MPLSHDGCQNFIKDHIDRHLRSVSSDFDNKAEMNGVREMEQEEPVKPIYDNFEEFEPRIITDPGLKPKIDLSANKKKVVRTRFLSTELGIREQLFVGVLTSPDSLMSMGVAFNKTSSHLLEKIEYFVQSSGDNHPLTLPKYMTVKTTEEGDAVRALHDMISVVVEQYKDTYDWFFFAKDSMYLEGDRIKDLVSHISINKKLYMGLPQTANIDSEIVSYCSIENGILFSRVLLLNLAPGLKKCLMESSATQPDIWLGNCIHKTFQGSISCSNSIYDRVFHTYTITEANFDPEHATEDASFKNALTVANVQAPRMFYVLHRQFSQFEIEIASKKIEEIQKEIEYINTKLPESLRQSSWPLGINPPYKPTNRWDIIVWDYFTEEYSLTCPGEVPKCDLSGIDKLDIKNIIQMAMIRLNDKYNPQKVVLEKKKLLNGYRRFDPKRGMEYTLDLLLNAFIDGQKDPIEINHRVHLLRPLSQVELIPMPYVTESSKIHMILPLTADQKANFDHFMQKFATVCLESDDNVELNIVFVYDPADAQRIHDDDIFADIKRKLEDYEKRFYKKKPAGSTKLIPWVSIKTEVPSQLKTMDVIAKKFPTESLFFLTSVNAILDEEFLNRCRMNAVQGWQAFFPVPFSSYNPEIVYKGQPLPKEIEIKPSNGHFDLYSFDEICFYNADYMSARNKLTDAMGNTQESATRDPMDSLDIFNLFVKYSELHVFRAVEPQLKRLYAHRHCSVRSGDDLFKKCERSNAEGLASRTQLAMELFPDENDKAK